MTQKVSLQRTSLVECMRSCGGGLVAGTFGRGSQSSLTIEQVVVIVERFALFVDVFLHSSLYPNVYLQK